MRLHVAALWIFSLAFVLNSVVGQKNPHFMGNRTTMVHLFEWKWLDIAKECEKFLGPKGYGGVQISPPNENRVINSPSRPWWERYQPISYVLKTRSGTESELRQMISRCQRAGVRVYADVVVNHMSASNPGKSLGTAGSIAYYDKKLYPAVPYGPADFHAPCIIHDYHNPLQVRTCQLNTLLDLNQTRPHVRDRIVNYMNHLIDCGVAGFRIDAAKHMLPQDLHAIYGSLKNLNRTFNFPAGAKPYIYQEVIDLGGEAIKNSHYSQFGAVTEFKFSTEIGRVFHGRNQLQWLRNWGPDWSFLPTKDAIVFVDNHDNQRGHGAGGSDILTYKNGQNYKMAVIFMLAHPYGGVTRVMSSYSFESTDQGPPTTSDHHIKSPTSLPNGLCDTKASGWVCEHRWPEIASMVEFRNLVAGKPVEHWWDNGGNQIAFSRGNIGFVALNNDSGSEMKVTLQTGLPAGHYCDILGGGRSAKAEVCVGKRFDVDQHGKMHVELSRGPSAMAIHVAARVDVGHGTHGKH